MSIMKITRSLSRRRDPLGRAEVLLRLTVDHSRQYRIKSGIMIDSNWWKNGSIDTSGELLPDKARARERLAALEFKIYNICAATPREALSADYVRQHLGTAHPPARGGITGYIEAYVAKRQLSVSRLRQFRTLAGMLTRYERHTGRTFTPAAWDAARVADFVVFLRTEHINDPARRPRGHNTVCSVLGRLRALLRFAALQSGEPLPPFPGCAGFKTEVYGTPYYLTADEVEHIAMADLSDCRRLATQRDIFVFQCLTGVRVSDLMHLRADNISDGTLEYVAAKTRHARPEVVRVPLHRIAREIAGRYGADSKRGRLLPCIATGCYNRAIRAVLSRCGPRRAVAVLDPVTLREHWRPIAEVASSHLARRTFIGNLYRHAKDPCLVGALSGHKDGSKAFARYRCIDDGIKRELIEQTFCRQTPSR